MANAPPELRHQLRADWRAVQATTPHRVSAKRVSSAQSAWEVWSSFCGSIGVDTASLPPDPIPLLQIFAQRLRAGTLAPAVALSDLAAWKIPSAAWARRTPSWGPWTLGEMRTASSTSASPPSTALGATQTPPRASSPYYQRSCPKWCTWHVKKIPKRHEPPPSSSPSVSFSFFVRASIWVSPTTPQTTSFAYVTLPSGSALEPCSITIAPPADLQASASTFVTLTFTRQKNGVRNETVGHGRSGHPHLCPAACLVDRVLALRAFNADPSTPLNAFRAALTRPTRYVHAQDLTRRMRLLHTSY